MSAYYNEINPDAVAMLEQLIKDKVIADGVVDNRSIIEVDATDVKEFNQCHWFAGIGGWSVALRQANWPDTRKVWTGSCPCQPFSAAGKQKAQEDERHLRPTWTNLIRQSKPPIVFGEQVAKAISFGWLDELYDEVEPEGYSCASAVLPATSVGLPHERERLFFVCDANSSDADRIKRSERQDQNFEKRQTTKSFEEGRRRFFELVSGNDFPRVDTYDGVKRSLDGIRFRAPIQYGFGNAIVPEVAARFIMAVM